MLRHRIDAKRQQTCLTDQAAQKQLAAMKSQAEDLGVPGTPGFLINGTLVPNAATWAALEPALRAALHLK
jgi:protein-disulfide isomerase